MNSQIEVEIPGSHRLEWKSKRLFEESLEQMNMYMPFQWAIRDYGIDGQVEIASPHQNDGSLRPESKFFMVQLKCAVKLKKTGDHISYSVPVKKIMQWFRSNIPVLFAINENEDGTFYYRWIDSALIQEFDSVNPNWVNQTDITLKISSKNIFGKQSLGLIRDYVFSWRVPSLKIIEPGTYFGLKGKCSAALNQYGGIVKPFYFDSVTKDIDFLKTEVERAIYRVAITGPSRVGKSTLINALLRKNISPTGFFQTTGVPIQILPGKEETLRVYFKNGKSIPEKLSFENIEKYASQTHNEDNKKEVSVVVINIANRQLEKGVSLFDIPGLDDPDENIYNYAWNTVTKSNAVLYLIDASSAEHGGFVFKAEYKKHILELGDLDKIFLVFNKVNALTGDKLKLLQDRVEKDLKRLDLYDKVSDKIFYLSAEESLETRLNEETGTDSVQKLEDELWSFLLKEHKNGLTNLAQINQKLGSSAEDFLGLLNARLLDNDKRINLEASMTKVRDRIPELKTACTYRRNLIDQTITKAVENRKHKILLDLETYLKFIPMGKDFPSDKFIKDYLTQAARKTLDIMNPEYTSQVNLYKTMTDDWIEINLKDIRSIISDNSQQKIVDFSELENLRIPPVDLSSSFGLGLLAGILGALAAPEVAVAAAFFTFLGNLFLSGEDRRANRIAKTMDKVRKAYDQLFDKIANNYHELLKDHNKLILQYASDKIKSFFSDIEKQLQRYDVKISEEETEHYRNASKNIKSWHNELLKLQAEIKFWCE